MRALAVVGLVAGCIEVPSKLCEDGSICPERATCVTVSPLGMDETRCAMPDQVEACADADDGTPCTTTTFSGTCFGGACWPPACANGLVDVGEICDDGNVTALDGCAADCRSDESCGNQIIDLTTQETCDTGDPLGHDGCSGDCTAELPRWSTLVTERAEGSTGAFTYDARRHRSVYFGIANDSGLTTVEWDGARWSAPRPALSPTPRVVQASAYDAARGEMVMFSGNNDVADTWVWDGKSWEPRQPAVAPSPRRMARMVYDSRRQRAIMFGGGRTGMPALDETWAWDGATWTELDLTPRPAGRVAFAMAYDPRRDVVVMIGGIANNSYSNEVWEFDGTQWTDKTTTGFLPRHSSTAAFDPITQQVLVIGGVVLSGINTSVSRDVMAWNGTSWTQLADLPVITSSAAAVSDPARGRVVVLSSQALFEWDGVEWTQPAHSATPQTTISAREGSSAAFDALRREVVMFGGRTSAALTAETWRWAGAWEVEAAQSNGPVARSGAAMAFDEARGQIVMYGGCVGGNVALAETWIWDGMLWNATTATQPGPRCDASMTYDAKHQRVVLVGGHNNASSPSYATSTWMWDGTGWTELASAPSGRGGAAIAYDRVREQVVLFGGADKPATLSNEALADTWVLDDMMWEQRTLAFSPSARSQARMAWDAHRQRLVLAGGLSSESLVFADAWEWTGTAWEQVPAVGVPRRNHVMTTDPTGGVLLFGGSRTTSVAGVAGDTYRLRWDGPAAYETCAALDGDGDGLIGCDDPDCWATCSPLCPPGTTCIAGNPGCGDGSVDDVFELCFSCPLDVQPCAPRCGDFVCNGTETAGNCPGDC